jgi:hypothetical protein
MGFCARLLAILGLAAFAWPALAKKTGFTDPQRGVTMGYGLYLSILHHENVFDPVPALLASGTTSVGSEDVSLRPMKFGYFTTRGQAEVELYLRYLSNPRKQWSLEGGSTGNGFSEFRGYGFGANAGVALLQEPSFQVKFVLNAEYVSQRAKIHSVDTAQMIRLQTSSMLAGFGVQPEVWLFDLWALSLFAGYQYGFAREWGVAQNAVFLGRSFTEGTLSDPSGRASRAQFGGVLLEAALKLNFY